MAPPTDAPVRLQLKCPDIEDFVRRFARNVTRGGIFLPSLESRDAGSSIRFELALQDDTVVFAGEGVVTWVKPQGMGVKFTTLAPAAMLLLERLLVRRQEEQEAKAPAAAEAPAPAKAQEAKAPAAAEAPPPAKAK